MRDTKRDEGEEFVPETDSDMVREDVDVEGEELGAKDKLKSLREKLAICEKEKQENLNGWQRERADFLNYKRRTEEERGREKEQGISRLVSNLLPILDGFELGLKQKEDNGTFRSGMEQIHSQFLTLLKEYKVEMIDPTGEKFDPTLHEAISEQPVDDEAADHTVISTIQRGYKIGSTLIRPARVIVGIYKQ